MSIQWLNVNFLGFGFDLTFELWNLDLSSNVFLSWQEKRLHWPEQERQDYHIPEFEKIRGLEKQRRNHHDREPNSLPQCDGQMGKQNFVFEKIRARPKSQKRSRAGGGDK